MSAKSRPVFPSVPAAGYLGSYQASVSFLTAAPAPADTDYVSFRWTSTERVCVVTHLAVRASCVTTVGSGQYVFGVFAARGFTAADSAGTAPALGGNSFKKRTLYPTSALADLRFGSGAALVQGTRVLDSAPILQATLPGSQSFEAGDGPDHDMAGDPLVLVANEGLVLRNMVAVTGGLSRGSFRVEWMEFEASKFP